MLGRAWFRPLTLGAWFLWVGRLAVCLMPAVCLILAVVSVAAAQRRTPPNSAKPAPRAKATTHKPAARTNRKPAGRAGAAKTGIAGRTTGAAAKVSSPPAPRRSARVSADKTASARRGVHARRGYTTRATAGRRAREEEARAAIRRRAEQARLAALARIRAIDDGLRRATQANIAKDDLRGEDPTIRRIALDALGDRAGTVVVLEPTTGRVLSIVNQQWAVRTPFKPCSTIKVLTAYAALQEGLAAADEVVTVGGQTWTLQTAMARSNNEYFQVLGRRLGFERMVAYARRVGFGRPTGVNLPGEIGGVTPRVPPPDPGRMYSHGDGFGVTAIQLATFLGAVANGGTLYRPQILRTPREQAAFKPAPLRTLPLSDELRADLLTGLFSAVERGTARRSGAAAFGVAGKTGSCNCDFGARTRVGLFASFVDTPDQPGLLVTVITKGSTARGSSASVIAGHVYRGAAVAARVPTRRRIVPDPPARLAASNPPNNDGEPDEEDETDD